MLGFAAVLFEAFGAEAVEVCPVAEAGYGLFRFAAAFGPGFLKAAADFGAEFLVPLDGDIFEPFTDLGGTESVVPRGFDAWTGDPEFVSGKAGAHVEGIASGPAGLVAVEAVEGKRLADEATDTAVFGAAADHVAVAEVDVGDVARAAEEAGISRNGEAVAADG